MTSQFRSFRLASAKNRGAKILVICNLFPPLHAGTFDFRRQDATVNLAKRGHDIHILTSKYGLTTEQKDSEISRRLILNGKFEQPLVTAYGELKQIETYNNAVVMETIDWFQPELVYVWSLQGLSNLYLYPSQFQDLHV